MPHEGTHHDGSFASASLLTDGKRFYAYFGSRGLYALDLAGKVLWEKDLGEMQTRNGFGEGSSPALHGDTLVVNWDHEGADFIVALDATDAARSAGARSATSPRPGRRRSSSPGGAQPRWWSPGPTASWLRPRDRQAECWRRGRLTPNVIPSPVSGDGIVYVTSGFRGNALRAIRLSAAKGDLTGPPALVWRYDKDTPYVPSPLLYEGGCTS